MTPKFIFETMKKNEILSGNCSWSEYNIRCRFRNISILSPIQYLWLEITPITIKEYSIVIKTNNSEKEIARVEVDNFRPFDFLDVRFKDCHMVRNDDEAFVSIFDFDGFDCIQVFIPTKVCNALKVSF